MRRSLTDEDLLQLVKPSSRQCAMNSLLIILVRVRNSSLNLGDVFGACRGGAVHLAFFKHAN
jgi:hypothetical protein